MIRRLIGISILVLLFCACKPSLSQESEVKSINACLDSLNAHASNTNFDAYFELYTKDAIFIGTDATERWEMDAFKKFAKPYFDKGKAWSFEAIERKVQLAEDGKMAYFDELLDTQMKICRGSGVLKKVGGEWKIKQYVLSMTIPNALSSTVIESKEAIEDSLINRLKKEKK